MAKTTHSTETMSASNLTGAWRVVPARSELGFVTHIMFGRIPVRGRYSDYQGELHVDDAGYASGLLQIEAEAVSTGINRRDKHLRSEDFFHVDLHPHLRFELTSLLPGDDDGPTLIGTLHIRGQQLPIHIPVSVRAVNADELRLDADFEVDPRASGFEFKRLPSTAHVHAGLTLERIG